MKRFDLVRFKEDVKQVAQFSKGKMMFGKLVSKLSVLAAGFILIVGIMDGGIVIFNFFRSDFSWLEFLFWCSISLYCFGFFLNRSETKIELPQEITTTLEVINCFEASFVNKNVLVNLLINLSKSKSAKITLNRLGLISQDIPSITQLYLHTNRNLTKQTINIRIINIIQKGISSVEEALINLLSIEFSDILLNYDIQKSELDAVSQWNDPLGKQVQELEKLSALTDIQIYLYPANNEKYIRLINHSSLQKILSSTPTGNSIIVSEFNYAEVIQLVLNEISAIERELRVDWSYKAIKSLTLEQRNNWDEKENLYQQVLWKLRLISAEAKSENIKFIGPEFVREYLFKCKSKSIVLTNRNIATIWDAVNLNRERTILLTGGLKSGLRHFARKTAISHFGLERYMLFLDTEILSREDALFLLIGSQDKKSYPLKQGILSDFVTKNPFSLIVFESLEKATAEVGQLVKKIVTEKTIFDHLGNKIDFKNVNIILQTRDLGMLQKQIPRSIWQGIDVIADLNDLKRKQIEKEIELILFEQRAKLEKKGIHLVWENEEIKEFIDINYLVSDFESLLKKMESHLYRKLDSGIVSGKLIPGSVLKF